MASALLRSLGFGRALDYNPFSEDEGHLGRAAVRAADSAELGYGDLEPALHQACQASTFCANAWETAKASALLWGPVLVGTTVGAISGGVTGLFGGLAGGALTFLGRAISNKEINSEYVITGAKIGATLIGCTFGALSGALSSHWTTKVPLARDSTRKLIQNTEVLGGDSLNTNTGMVLGGHATMSFIWKELAEREWMPKLMRFATGFQFVRTGWEFISQDIERPGILNEDIAPLDMHAVELDASAMGTGLILGGAVGFCFAPTIATMVATSTVVSSLFAGTFSVLKPNFLRG